MASTRNPNQSVAKLTKTVVDRALPPASGQQLIRDSVLSGFALRVTAGGVKSFVIEKRIEGRVRRITLGRYGALTVEQARKQAQKLLGQIATGVNPVAVRAQERLRSVTLQEAFVTFQQTRKALKPRTLYDYQRLLAAAFTDWRTRPLSAITKEMVSRRHSQLGESSGPAYANSAMRFLRSLFNFAIAQYEDGFGNAIISENPVVRLSRTRAWFTVERRQGVIKAHELQAWWIAVGSLRSDLHPQAEVVADYLQFLLLSGLRRQEAAQLTWDRIDLISRSLTVLDTKNHTPHVLPLSDALADILKRREGAAHNRFVFSGEGPAGYLIEPKRHIAKVIERCGVTFRIHDLRRTFITTAEALDVSPYAIKRLVNHRIGGDVTAGYIISDIERLRGPMQKISEFFMKACGVIPAAVIHALPPERRARQSG